MVNQFTLELIQMLSKTSQLEENRDIRIFSELDVKKNSLHGKLGSDRSLREFGL